MIYTSCSIKASHSLTPLVPPERHLSDAEAFSDFSYEAAVMPDGALESLCQNVSSLYRSFACTFPNICLYLMARISNLRRKSATAHLRVTQLDVMVKKILVRTASNASSGVNNKKLHPFQLLNTRVCRLIMLVKSLQTRTVAGRQFKENAPFWSSPVASDRRNPAVDWCSRAL